MQRARFFLGSILAASVLAACSGDLLKSGNLTFSANVPAEACPAADASTDATTTTDEPDAASHAPDTTVATYALGGTVAGLAAGDTLVLENDGGDDVTVSTDGAFELGRFPAASTYAVTVKRAPATSKYCFVQDGAGTVGTTDVTLAVTCTASASYAGGYIDRGQTSLVDGNALHGNKVTLAAASSVFGFGVIGRAAGPHVKMALYTDVGGKPSKLVASTDGTALVNGRLEILVTPTQVPAGSYWVMAVYDGFAAYGQQLSVSATASATTQPYASTLPATYPTTGSSYTSGLINYYVIYQ